MDPSIKSRRLSPLNPSKIYFGWWTILVTGMLSGLGHGFYGLGISIFFKDLSAEFGINRAMTSLAAGIGRLEGGITSPLVGWLSDRYGPKWIIFTGVSIAGTGMILMNFVSTLWEYTLVWGVMIGIGVNIGLTIAVDKALNDWFILKRGLAQGTKFALIGIGSVITLPIVTVLVSTFGWRITCVVWGCLILVCSPLVLLFVKQHPPEYYGLLPDGKKADTDQPDVLDGENHPAFPQKPTILHFEKQEINFTFQQAIKTRSYWFIAIAMGMEMFVVGGMNIHMIPFLTDLGIRLGTAGAMMGMMVFFTIPSRFFGGILSDRVGRKNQYLLLAGILFIQTTSLAIILISQKMVPIYLFIGLYGFASGAITPLFIIAIGSYFGRKSFGIIFGSSMVIRAPLSLAAPVFTGWIFDRTGSYNTAFIVFFACSLLAALLMCILRPSKLYALKTNDIKD
ncbi:MFS transporter [Desulfobacula sp.]|uniref:MFS transporter n=1 Tax=Desulfobacula sp. TaxID=2593537 RepID=UPI002638A187|nr:MFS transporter [Desulfobacula sp.]